MIPDLKIPVPEIFIHPEIRENLYVPGSPKATVSLVGWYRLCSKNAFITVVIITARNEFAEGNDFTGVCQSFCPQEVPLNTLPPSGLPYTPLGYPGPYGILYPLGNTTPF